MQSLIGKQVVLILYVFGEAVNCVCSQTLLKYIIMLVM